MSTLTFFKIWYDIVLIFLLGWLEVVYICWISISVRAEVRNIKNSCIREFRRHRRRKQRSNPVIPVGMKGSITVLGYCCGEFLKRRTSQFVLSKMLKSWKCSSPLWSLRKDVADSWSQLSSNPLHCEKNGWKESFRLSTWKNSFHSLIQFLILLWIVPERLFWFEVEFFFSLITRETLLWPWTCVSTIIWGSCTKSRISYQNKWKFLF